MTNLYEVNFVVNEFETDIFLKISCKNKEFISKVSLKLSDKLLERKNTICNESCISFVFSCPNTLLNGCKEFEKCTSTQDCENLKKLIFKCILSSHFNQVEFNLDTLSEFEKGFSKKKENIEKMELDLLYLSAMFYVNSFKNAESKKLRERCDQIVSILIAIDKYWEKDLDKTKIHGYNEEKGKATLFERLQKHLAGTNNSNLIIKENDSFKDRFVNLNKFVNIEELVEKKDDGYNDDNCYKKLILDIMPTCYELSMKQNMSTASSNNFIKYYNKTGTVLRSLLSPIAYSIIYFSSSSYFNRLESYIFNNRLNCLLSNIAAAMRHQFQMPLKNKKSTTMKQIKSYKQ